MIIAQGAIQFSKSPQIKQKIKFLSFFNILSLTLMLLVANLADTKCFKIPLKMTETLAHGYSSESTQRELSNEYEHDRV